MDRRNFIKGCLFCASLPALCCLGGYLYKKKGGLTLSDNDSKILKHIEIHLVEHCNLNCKYCWHFSSIAEKKFLVVEKFEQDMKQLAKVTGSKLGNIQLMGGEPLLHPEIIRFFEISRKYFPNTKIDLITNGKLLDSMNTDFWKAMNVNKIRLVPSVYAIAINWDSIIKKAKTYGVQMLQDDTGVKITTKNIYDIRRNIFLKIKLDLKGKQDLKHYYKCLPKSDSNNFKDGKIFPCFISANIEHFNKKFGKSLEITDKDYIDIYKVNDLDEILEFLKTPKPFCKYCIGERTSVENWSYSKEHTIEEWT